MQQLGHGSARLPPPPRAIVGPREGPEIMRFEVWETVKKRGILGYEAALAVGYFRIVPRTTEARVVSRADTNKRAPHMHVNVVRGREPKDEIDVLRNRQVFIKATQIREDCRARAQTERG